MVFISAVYLPFFSFQYAGLEAELDEKDHQLVKVTSQYHQVECELQHSKQDMLYTQEHLTHLEKQVTRYLH